jgi:cytoskeletal protein CcmA (bactofilin family)
MFNKTQDRAPAPGPTPNQPHQSHQPMTNSPAAPPLEPAAAPRRAAKIPSVIADDVVIEGVITGQGELHIDGTVKGDVRVTRLSLGESGRIEGSATADIVEARGHIVGSVTAKQIRLFAGASVDGDLTHEQLAIEIGASFQGRSLKFKRPPEPRVEPKITPRITPSSLAAPIDAKPAETKPSEPLFEPKADVSKLNAVGNG